MIIDELPPTHDPLTDSMENELAVKVRMRYSIPLFIYGKGLNNTQQQNKDSELWNGLQAQLIKKIINALFTLKTQEIIMCVW